MINYKVNVSDPEVVSSRDELEYKNPPRVRKAIC